MTAHWRIPRILRAPDVPSTRKTRICADCSVPIYASGGKKRCVSCSYMVHCRRSAERKKRLRTG